MEDVFIVSAKRTPIGKFGKSLSKLKATDLGGLAIKASIESSGLSPDKIEEVIMGNVIQAGNGQNPAGKASALAGLSDTVTKYTVNTVCASGMVAVENAFREIALGEREIIVAGGMESMSNSPLMISPDFRWGPGQLLNRNYDIQDSMLTDGLLDSFTNDPMGQFAERSASKFSITREQADEFALSSFTRADRATRNGDFIPELCLTDGLDRDEGIRDTSLDILGKLRSSFKKDGVLTAGNSSQLSDGASALVLASSSAVREHGLEPLCRITGFSSASLSPFDFVEAPIPATRQLLEKQDKKIGYYDLVEHNEAFSVASIIVRNELGIDDAKLNVNGGAVAMGHPLGNSGSRILVTLIHALKKNGLETGLATICHGGGGGHTLTVEMK